MPKPTTHVLLVTDKSGSMAALAEDVRGGFNTYVSDLKARKAADENLRFRLTVALFDHEYRLLCTAAKLSQVPELDAVNYRPGGNTALLDAVGHAITAFDAATDGQENSSREYTWDTVSKMLEQRAAGGKWSIIYLGQGVDSWAQGSQFGVSTQVIRTTATGAATKGSYTGLSAATAAYASAAPGEVPSAANLSGIVAAAAGVSDEV